VVPLRRRDLPASKDELAQAVEAELRRFIRKTGPIVDVRSRAFPYIDEVAINLDDAEIAARLPPPQAVTGATKLAFEVGTVDVTARNIRLHGTALDLRAGARGVFLDQGLDANGEIVLLPRKIRDGEISLSATQVDLEEAIAKVVAELARAQGVTIEQVRLAIRERGPRSIAAEVRIQARKFVRVKIDIYGQLDIDENFAATISQLRCQGAGVIAARACSALEPRLRRFNGRSFPLKSLALGETQLRNLRIAVTNTVEIRLEFGSSETRA